jgi:glycosyltransferase involved in cell wall biosynthesis/peptidoglycan/xylan/chitin deacetylase (PgdA/CDA1 family)
VTLDGLVAAVAEGASVDDAVVVTFDDGYADNLLAALPLLERHGVPATFFIPSGAIDATHEFWWDELEGLLLGREELPPQLRLSIEGQAYRYDLGAATRLSPEQLAASGWVAWEPPPTPRHALYVELWTRCQMVSAQSRDDVFRQLRTWAAHAPPRAERRTLSTSELRTMAASPLADIAGHTITHPSLASLPLHEQRREIVHGRLRLDELIGRAVRSFSYPFGKVTDYSSETIHLVREAGYRAACSNFGGLVTQHTDIFQLPRLFVRDLDGPAFWTWLTGELVARDPSAAWAASRVTTRPGPILDLGGFTATLPTNVAHRVRRIPPFDSAASGVSQSVESTLPAPSAEFDFVLAGEDQITVGPDPAARMGEVLRVLRPGGRLLVKLRHRKDSDLWRWNRGRFFAVSRDVRGDVVCYELMAPETPSIAARGAVDLGDLRRVEPVSRQFGFDRGQPVDRHYIEAFLSRHASDIRGCVLEIGDDTYTWRFGGDRVTTSEVLHVVAENPRATIVGDLANPDGLPRERYDCIICTQTLHLVFDLPTAVKSLRQMLKPGGVLLATCPGITRIAGDQWKDTWFWSLTALSATRLFDDAFGAGSATVETQGSVLSAVAFLEGLARDELTETELDHHDPSFPVVVTIRAARQGVFTTGLEIVSVSRPAFNPGVLAGAYLDSPVEGLTGQGDVFPFKGWVVGQESPIRNVEIAGDGFETVRVPVERERPDVLAYLPERPWSGVSGFEAILGVSDWPGGQLQVSALMADGGPVALGTITAQRTRTAAIGTRERDLVSVVLPCYNQAHYLAAAIESVLAQTYSNVEVVVVDDGSTDNTHEVAARYPDVRCVRQSNKGLSAARNAGLRSATGTFITFLDADDTLEPEAVARGLECLRAHPEAAFAYGKFLRTNANGEVLADEPHAPIGSDAFANLLRGNHIGMHAAVLYRRAVLQLVDGFDEGLRACEDYDLYFRIARRLPIAGHPHVVARYRRHEASMSSNEAMMLRVALEVLERQRAFLDDPSRVAAYREGYRNWSSYYGPQILARIRSDLRRRGIGAATLRNLWTIARYAPGELFAAIGNATRRGSLLPPTPS